MGAGVDEVDHGGGGARALDGELESAGNAAADVDAIVCAPVLDTPVVQEGDAAGDFESGDGIVGVDEGSVRAFELDFAEAASAAEGEGAEADEERCAGGIFVGAVFIGVVDEEAGAGDVGSVTNGDVPAGLVVGGVRIEAIVVDAGDLGGVAGDDVVAGGLEVRGAAPARLFVAHLSAGEDPVAGESARISTDVAFQALGVEDDLAVETRIGLAEDGDVEGAGEGIPKSDSTALGGGGAAVVLTGINRGINCRCDVAVVGAVVSADRESAPSELDVIVRAAGGGVVGAAGADDDLGLITVGIRAKGAAVGVDERAVGYRKVRCASSIEESAIGGPRQGGCASTDDGDVAFSLKGSRDGEGIGSIGDIPLLISINSKGSSNRDAG